MSANKLLIAVLLAMACNETHTQANVSGLPERVGVFRDGPVTCYYIDTHWGEAPSVAISCLRSP